MRSGRDWTNDPTGAARRTPAQDRHGAAMNVILYLLRTGCPWRYLPRHSFPPRSTVYNIFRKFQHDGVWEAIWAELHMALRARMGRPARQRRFSTASDQVGRKGGGNDDKIGYDAGKKVKGRALVDAEALPMRS
jgi:putative transposase